ncbi:hypothetical protein [Peptoclostridium acidaminophilum]|uniref:hypothetical protein n=1 Tax=Peptoclostridium acidaminophilum TaxID=1731 RepID=UPI00046C97E4|nr:hypothetical protein [Peptoclostridium acidaminophilum]
MLSGVVYKIFLNNEGNLDVAEIHESEDTLWEGIDFMPDENGKELKFTRKMEAVQWLRDNCVQDFISPEYKKIDWSKYRK